MFYCITDGITDACCRKFIYNYTNLFYKKPNDENEKYFLEERFHKI